MRALALAVLLTACEPTGQVAHYTSDTTDTVDPYGDSEPECPVLTAREIKRRACEKDGKVLLHTQCTTKAYAVELCKSVEAGVPICYGANAAACVPCGFAGL